MAEKCVSCEANKQGVTITKDTINGLKDTIRNLYLCDDIPWVIGYSEVRTVQQHYSWYGWHYQNYQKKN